MEYVGECKVLKNAKKLPCGSSLNDTYDIYFHSDNVSLNNVWLEPLVITNVYIYLFMVPLVFCTKATATCYAFVFLHNILNYS